MRNNELRTTLALTAAVLLLAAAAGLIIPLASGNQPGGGLASPWTPPPTPEPTTTVTASPTPTRAATRTPTPAPPQPSPRPILTATVTATQPVASPAATVAPTSGPRATQTTVQLAPPTTLITSTAPLAQVVATDPLLLRAGPGQEHARIGIARNGDTFEIVGRNGDATWWQVCCYNGQTVWVFAEFVSVTGPTDKIVTVP